MHVVWEFILGMIIIRIMYHSQKVGVVGDTASDASMIFAAAAAQGTFQQCFEGQRRVRDSYGTGAVSRRTRTCTEAMLGRVRTCSKQ